MESLIILMPDGLLTKLCDVATRRGMSMGDMIVEMCRKLVEPQRPGVEGHFQKPNGGR